MEDLNENLEKKLSRIKTDNKLLVGKIVAIREILQNLMRE